MGKNVSDLLKTPLYDLHVKSGGRMVAFAGYDMPVQYKPGIVAEHTHTRQKTGIFDVSHMGQAFLIGPDHETVADALEKLVPAEIKGLEPGQQRYTQLINADGGIIDDLMVTRPVDEDGTLFLVVNAACKQGDYDWIRQNLPHGIHLEEHQAHALIAVQGPASEKVVASHCPDAAAMNFMDAMASTFDGLEIHISRSGYTGEDGYEISVADEKAVQLVEGLLAHDDAMLIGLGARDSLRLEAGLCLYGHDIDEKTSPVEAGLLWSIGKRRRRQGGFIGHERILREIAEKPSRRRVGIKPLGRAPARQGTQILSPDGNEIGTITSGGFGPTYGGPVAMGYVQAQFASAGTPLQLLVRGKPLPAEIFKLPFVAHNFKR
jgi:aminomethyltransferase